MWRGLFSTVSWYPPSHRVQVILWVWREFLKIGENHVAQNPGNETRRLTARNIPWLLLAFVDIPSQETWTVTARNTCRESRPWFATATSVCNNNICLQQRHLDSTNSLPLACARPLIVPLEAACTISRSRLHPHKRDTTTTDRHLGTGECPTQTTVAPHTTITARVIQPGPPPVCPCHWPITVVPGGAQTWRGSYQDWACADPLKKAVP